MPVDTSTRFFYCGFINPINHSRGCTTTGRPRRPIAIFGGTFNPPHRGHLRAASEALRRLNLARVLFIPSANPPHKPLRNLASARARYQMIRLAVAPYKRFAVSSIELRRPGPSFTYDTVRTIRRRYPRRTLYFIIGADTVTELPTWHRYRELIQQVRFVVVSRPGHRLKPLSEFPCRFVLLPIPGLKVSSSAVRKKLARGLRPVHDLPRRVADYIHQRRLYHSS